MTTPIFNITPFTLLDFPDKTACILWFAGCNMKCVYCYNPEIVRGKGKLSFDDALKFLDARGKLLDGVVLSGGECTLHGGIDKFLIKLKERDLKVKIDTNGSKPMLMEALLREGLVDYVALDFKALPGSFRKITVSNLYENFGKTLDILLKSNVQFEVRTTVHSHLIPPDDLTLMANFLSGKGYNGNYFIQHFVNGSDTLAPLPASSRLVYNDFTNPDIQVIFRN